MCSWLHKSFGFAKGIRPTVQAKRLKPKFHGSGDVAAPAHPALDGLAIDTTLCDVVSRTAANWTFHH